MNNTMTKTERDALILANMGLVKSIANKYTHKHELESFDFDDLVQEGVIALMHAIDTYDPASGYTFSTYATRVITNTMSREVIEKDSMIRLPEVFAIKRYNQKRKGEQVVAVPRASVRLEQHVGGQKAQMRGMTETVADTIRDRQPSSHALVGFSESSTTIYQKIIEHLEPREATVVMLHFGLCADGAEHDLATIGRMLHVSRERIRQTRNKAFEKLRPHLMGEWKSAFVA